jgi:hypothetical protein
MTRLAWNAIGERFFDTGIDHGVLYVDGLGVAWQGLISVSESPSGGGAKPLYIDGFKYLNVALAEEFEATITAFGAPAEFGPCDGLRTVHTGLTATQQPRKSFSMSFRTKIGNDVDGTDHGYKIHLVYNALAAPSGRPNATISDSVEPTQFSWAITTLPPRITGFKPTAHFVIDSRTTDAGVLTQVEDLLYGTEISNPTLPSVATLVGLFSD